MVGSIQRRTYGNHLGLHAGNEPRAGDWERCRPAIRRHLWNRKTFARFKQQVSGAGTTTHLQKHPQAENAAFFFFFGGKNGQTELCH